MSETKSPSDFEIAATVEVALKDLPKPRQELVLRWVCESLGIIAPQAAPPLAPPIAPHNPVPPAGTPQPAVDIATFVNEKQPRSDIQFVTVVAFYYRFVAPAGQRLATINTEVAQDATRLVNRDRLTSPRNTLNNAKAQGYLDSATAGEFSVNTVGENLVARTLPREGEASGKKASSNKASSKKASSKKASSKKKSAKR